MASFVYFKFKSQKEATRVEIDGTGIQVFELKREIIIRSGLGDGKDFDLAIYNEDGMEGRSRVLNGANRSNKLLEYSDDTTMIPRATSIIARRLPPMKAGAGRAARYMTGKVPTNLKNSSRKEQPSTKSNAKPAPMPSLANSNLTEEQRIAAMFAAQDQQWASQQEEMALYVPIRPKHE